MKFIVRSLVCVAAVIAVLCASERKPLTNADIVKMVKAELPDSTIVLAIKSSAPAFDTSPDGLIALKTAGISPAIIDAMLTAKAGPSDVAEPPKETEVEKLVANLAKTQSEGALTVAAFTKSDGQMINEMGRRFYLMDFQAFIRVSEECIWRNVTLEPQLVFHVARKSQAGSSGGGWGDFLYLSQNPGLRVNGGTVLEVRGQVRLEKAESGWRIVSMSHSGITQASTSAITRIQGARNEAKTKEAGTVTTEELASLIAAVGTTAAAQNELFTSTNGKVSVKTPVGFSVTKGNGDVVGRFARQEGTTPLSITVTCTAPSFLTRNPSLQSLVEVTMASIKDANPGAVFTAAVPTKLAGVDAATFAYAVVDHGKVLQKAATVAICQKHSLGVILHSTPEGFKDGWDAYRLVCDSYAFTGK